MSKLNMQWHPVTGVWRVDCPLCRHKTAMTWQEGATKYTCPQCRTSFTEETLFNYMTIADYFNHPRVRLECLKQAQENYPQAGRGVIILDGRAWPEAPQTYYLSRTKAEETIGWPDETVEQWVKTYDPAQEVFVYILNNDGSLADWQRLRRGSPGEVEQDADQRFPEPNTSGPDASESAASKPDEISWGFVGLVQKGVSPAVAYDQIVSSLIADPAALAIIEALDDETLAQARTAWCRQGFPVPPWERARQMMSAKKHPDRKVDDAETN